MYGDNKTCLFGSLAQHECVCWPQYQHDRMLLRLTDCGANLFFFSLVRWLCLVALMCAVLINIAAGWETKRKSWLRMVCVATCLANSFFALSILIAIISPQGAFDAGAAAMFLCAVLMCTYSFTLLLLSILHPVSKIRVRNGAYSLKYWRILCLCVAPTAVFVYTFVCVVGAQVYGNDNDVAFNLWMVSQCYIHIIVGLVGLPAFLKYSSVLQHALQKTVQVTQEAVGKEPATGMDMLHEKLKLVEEMLTKVKWLRARIILSIVVMESICIYALVCMYSFVTVPMFWAVLTFAVLWFAIVYSGGIAMYIRVKDENAIQSSKQSAAAT